MKFLVDAQLPYRLSDFMKQQAHDSIHALDLPNKNSTSDKEINQLSMNEKRILITKDDGFVSSIVLQNRPYKLLHITTGTISNNDLISIFDKYLPLVISQFKKYSYIELNQFNLIPHF